MKTIWKLLILALSMTALLYPLRSYADDQKTDGEIIGLLMAADKNEIAVAKQALGKDLSPEVKAYAQMLESEHTEDFNKLEELSKTTSITPPLTVGAQKRGRGTAMLLRLLPLNGKDYDKAFIDAMVKDHTEDLQEIDNDFIKNVKNPALKMQLDDTRSHIALHLNNAKQLQGSL